MTTGTPLEIKVIFDAGARRRPGRTPGPSLPRSRQQGARGWTVLALMNLLAASAFYYAIWWRVDPELYLILMMKTPVSVDLDMAAGIFIPSAEPRAPRGVPQEPVPQPVAGQFDSHTAQWLIPTTAYAWLTLATVATCAVGLSCGAAVRRAGGPHWRTFGWLASAVLLLGLLASGVLIGRQYGAGYLPSQLRIGMGGLVLLCTAGGVALGSNARRLSRLAGWMLILAGVATAAGLYLGAKAGAIEPRFATPPALAAAWAAHSAYGWLLLAAVWRLAR